MTEKEQPEAPPEPRMLVVATDGNKTDLITNTMGLWELKAILDALLSQVQMQITATGQPPPSGDEPEDTE